MTHTWPGGVYNSALNTQVESVHPVKGVAGYRWNIKHRVWHYLGPRTSCP